MNKKNRIFISYSYSDKAFADRVINALRHKGVEVHGDLETINAGDFLFERLQYLYESSETVIILLSKSFYESVYSEIESDELLHIAQKRKISIISVQIENCKIPDTLMNFPVINIAKNFDRGVENIIEKLKILPEIDFEKFSATEFEKFVHDFLTEYEFKNLSWNSSGYYTFGFELMSTYYNRDPFGQKTPETWLIEIKFYRDDRFSINSIRQLIDLFKSNKKPNMKVLLVTNSILTSVVEEFLNEIKNKDNIPIFVLDGNALKKLAAKKKNLINKYFKK